MLIKNNFTYHHNNTEYKIIRRELCSNFIFVWYFYSWLGFDGKSSNGYDNEEALHQNIEEESEFIASRIRDGRGGSRRIKVEKLGNTLRKRVSKLRSREGVDLVFLVDSSASVGSQNFYNEIKFIRKVINVLHMHTIRWSNNH